MGNWIEIPETLSFSGTAANARALQMPAVRVDAVMMHVKYTVTDAGISAGETFEGCIEKLEIGQGSANFLEVRRDELTKLIDFVDPGISNGAYSDVMPVTATQTDAYFMIPGPFRLGDVKNPGLTLALRAITDEFGAASAFTATVKISVNVSDVQTGPGLVYKRNAYASSTNHKFVTPQAPFVDLITGVFIELGASNLDQISYPQHSPEGKPIMGSDSIDFDEGKIGKFHYCVFKETAYSTSVHRYLFGTIENPPGQSDIILDCSLTGATTAIGWVQGLKLGV